MCPEKLWKSGSLSVPELTDIETKTNKTSVQKLTFMFHQSHLLIKQFMNDSNMIRRKCERKCYKIKFLFLEMKGLSLLLPLGRELAYL